MAILLPVAINLISASFVIKSETLIVIIKIILLVFIIAASASYVDIERLSPMKWESSFSIVVSGMIIFVAYEGFELIANAAEDIKNPESNLPRAFYGSVLLVILLYVLIAIITVGTVPESQLVMAKDYALAVAAKPALGQVGFTIVAIAALLATFSAINATIYGNARLSYMLASLVSFMALMTLLIHTYSNTPRAIVIFLSFIAISFLFELSYGKIIRKHIFSRPY